MLEHRAKRGGKITSPEALGEPPGVGPATVDQLRAALASREGRLGRAARCEADAEKTAETVRGGVRVARKATQAGAPASTAATRSGVRLVERTAGAFGEAQRATARRSAEATTELGRLFVELLSEQTRHNLEVATAFGQAANWGETIKLQNEFVRANFERFNRLNGRYLEGIQDPRQRMWPMLSASGQARSSGFQDGEPGRGPAAEEHSAAVRGDMPVVAGARAEGVAAFVVAAAEPGG